MLNVNNRTKSAEMQGIYADFIMEMQDEGWRVRRDMGKETGGYLEREPPNVSTAERKKGRSRSQGPRERRGRWRVHISDEEPF